MSRSIFSFLSIILVSSLILRVTNLSLIEFKTDEAINLYLASRVFFGYSIPPGSTASSLGILNPPLILYLLLPFLSFTKNPVLISGYIAVINALSIMGFFLILRKYYTVAVAFLTSLLLAFSPWHILFSRKIWAQDFLFPFLVFQILAVHKIVVDKNERYWMLFSIISLFLIQLHQATFFYVFIITLPLLRYINKRSFKFLLYGLIIGLLPLIPYLAYQIENSCPDCTALSAISEKSQQENILSFLLRPFEIVGVGGFYTLFGDDFLRFSQVFPLAYNSKFVFYLYLLFIPLGIIFFVRKYRKLWFFVLPLIFLPSIYFFFEFDNQLHYYIVLIPYLYLFASFFLVRLISSITLIARLIGIICVSLILFSSLFYMSTFFHFLSYYNGLAGEYGLTYRKSQHVAFEKFKAYTNDSHYEEMILLDFIPYQYSYSEVPFSTMLYNKILTEDEIVAFETRLKKVPIDPRARNPLLSYFTQKPLSKQTVRNLRSRVKTEPSLSSVLEPVYEKYLADSLQKSGQTDDGQLLYEYPQHWRKIYSENHIILTNDEYSIAIDREKDVPHNFVYAETITLFEYDIPIYDCVKEKIWCGLLATVSIGDEMYVFQVIPRKNVSLHDPQISDYSNAFKRVIQSVEVI